MEPSNLDRRAVRRGLAAGLAATTIPALTGCRASTATEAPAPPPPLVTVITAARTDVPIRVEAIGTTRALESVILRARVNGFLTEKHFEEGADVPKGDPGNTATPPLLVIDEAPYRATLDAARAAREEAEANLMATEGSKRVPIAQAQLVIAQARLALAQIEEARIRRLVETRSASSEEYDRQAAALKEAQGTVDARRADLLQAQVDYDANLALARANLDKAKAAVTQAELDLGYCRMYAPIAGRAGELKVKVGNYVDAVKQAELLSIQQLDPMGMDLQPSSRYLPETTALIDRGLEVYLVVQGDRPYTGPDGKPIAGRVFFLDNTVDPTTSTFLVRASIPNPKCELLPGDYVKVNMVIGEYAGVVAVPEQAVVETQAGPVVNLVDAGGVVRVARVEPLDEYRGLRVLRSGVEPGQRVIVEGFQMVRPGQAVRTRGAELASFLRPDAGPGRVGERLLDNPNVRLRGRGSPSPPP